MEIPHDYNETFIRYYDNAVSTEFCQGVIKYFEWANQNNRTWNRTEATRTVKHDESTCLDPRSFWDIDFTWEHLTSYLQEFNEAFWDVCYKSYCEEFDTLNNVNQHTIFNYKVQKTLPGGGYHVWHCEHDSISHSRRLGTYSLFLNDVAEGGETEFLYQNQRLSPKEGRLVIFPAGYTHTHRGNPPLRGVKYILTGWVEFS
jgi:hypothetical protein